MPKRFLVLCEKHQVGVYPSRATARVYYQVGIDWHSTNILLAKITPLLNQIQRLRHYVHFPVFNLAPNV